MVINQLTFFTEMRIINKNFYHNTQLIYMYFCKVKIKMKIFNR